MFNASAVNRDGSYDFSMSNTHKRLMFEDRLFEVEIAYEAKDIFELQKKNSLIATWLIGEGKLIFDDTADKYWMAIVTTGIGYVPTLDGHVVKQQVIFRVKPFSYGINGYVTQNTTFNSSTRQLVINNVGTAAALPIIEVSSGNSLTVSTLSYRSSFTNLVIDCEKCVVTQNGLRVKEFGEFFELVSGENVLDISFSGSSATDVKIRYLPRYF